MERYSVHIKAPFFPNVIVFEQIDEKENVSHISACMILHRSDKQPDRVEISPEQLCGASAYAEQLASTLNRPMRVIGWYHSHPHITVWPSHVGRLTVITCKSFCLH